MCWYLKKTAKGARKKKIVTALLKLNLNELLNYLLILNTAGLGYTRPVQLNVYERI